MNLCCDVLKALAGKTLATAESCTGGGLGAALTAVPGSSAVYKGGVISYCNAVKQKLLAVPTADLERLGPVSEPVAVAMAQGARQLLETDVAVSVTGLAGPGGDGTGVPVGTVFIGYADAYQVTVRQFHFSGNREQIRQQTAEAAFSLILQMQHFSSSREIR